jgi:hypothetical protein
MPRPSELYKKGEQPSLSVLLCQPFLNKITRKALFGKSYARAIELIDVEERLYSIGAALGHAMRNKLDTLAKLLFVSGKESHRIDEVMRLCKKDARKNLEEFRNKHGRDPDTFGDFISYRSVENLLRNKWVKLSAKEATEAYTEGNRRIKKIFDLQVELEGNEQRMIIMLLQGIQFGSSFPELTERMYQKACEDNKNFWAGKWHGLTIPEELKIWSLEETQRAVLRMVAVYTSEYYPELLDPLGLRVYLNVEGSS